MTKMVSGLIIVSWAGLNPSGPTLAVMSHSNAYQKEVGTPKSQDISPMSNVPSLTTRQLPAIIPDKVIAEYNKLHMSSQLQGGLYPL